MSKTNTSRTERPPVRCAGRAIARGACIAFIAAGLACGPTPEAGPLARAARPEHPVLLVGLDGFEWNVALPLLREGRLPHLASVIRRGVHGELASLEPTHSPVIWTSIATGHRPERHGILGFKRAKGRDSPLVTNSDRRTKAFWNVASEHGLRVATVGWWLTWPVEAIHGVMVAQINYAAASLGRSGVEVATGDLATEVFPAERAAAVAIATETVSRDLDRYLTGLFGAWDSAGDEVAERLWSNTRWSVRADAIYRRVAIDLLAERSGFDLMAVYFGGSDVVGHRFWRYREPDRFDHPPRADAVAALGGTLGRYYEQLDSFVGELVAAAPADAVVVVVSDHGMHAIQTDAPFRAGDPNRAILSGGHDDAPPCFFAAAGPGIRQEGAPLGAREDLPSLGSVLDLTPTLFALLDLPIADDFEGRVMTEILEPSLLERRPLRRVATHTPADWYAGRPKPDLELRNADERREQLRALGYIE